MIEYNKKYGTYDRQIELLEMIKDIDKLFVLNNIQYSLCSGSLLGAIRENGFIPWDDDIDIMVDRDNFNKLISLFNNDCNITKYVLKRYLWILRIQKSNDKRQGLHASSIDIFVADNCPDCFVVYKLKVLFIKILQGMMKLKIDYSKYSIFYRFCLFFTNLIGKLVNDQKKYEYYQIVSQMNNKKKTSNISFYNDIFSTLNFKYPNSLFENITRHKFEDTYLPIVSQYDIYLSTRYGDYMTPPEPEKRISTHLEI